MPTRTIAYVRVSTDKQADRGVSLDAQRAKVPAVTGGRLRFGMSADDVKKVLGTPKDEQAWQKAGGLTLVYDDLTLTFDGGLVDVEKPAKEADKPSDKPTTRPAKPQ